MECISELKDSLNAYFGWNKARMACFVTSLGNRMLVRLAYKTINFQQALNILNSTLFTGAVK
jgi:hypothetical protein